MKLINNRYRVIDALDDKKEYNKVFVPGPLGQKFHYSN